MTKPQTNLLSGTYVVGHFLGYEEKAWANDATKYNRRIGIKTSEYETSFGQVGSNVQLVDIQSQDVDYIKNSINDLDGKLVKVPVVFRARAGGRNGAFLSCFMPKDARISPID